MENIEVKSALLKRDFCKYSYDLPVVSGTKDSISRTGSSIVHDDMKALFNKLSIHLALVTEEIDAKTLTEVEPLEKYRPQHRLRRVGHTVQGRFLSRFTSSAFPAPETVRDSY